MAKALLTLVAALWAFLWVLISLLEIMPFLHNARVPSWQPIALIAPSVLVAAVWVSAWLASPAMDRISLEHPRRWFFRALLYAPLFALIELGFVQGVRAEIFAVAHLPFWHVPWPALIPYEIIKTTLFIALWLGLALGVKTFVAWQEQSRHLLEVQKSLTEAIRQTPMGGGAQQVERLPIPVGDQLRLIDKVTITWVEADDNYVRIHTDTHEYFLRSTLQDLLAQLGEDRFRRIHKSRAVNIAAIEALRPLLHGDVEVMLKDGTRLRASRRFRQALLVEQ